MGRRKPVRKEKKITNPITKTKQITFQTIAGNNIVDKPFEYDMEDSHFDRRLKFVIYMKNVLLTSDYMKYKVPLGFIRQDDVDEPKTLRLAITDGGNVEGDYDELLELDEDVDGLFFFYSCTDRLKLIHIDSAQTRKRVLG